MKMSSKLEVEEGKFTHYESTEDAFGGMFYRYPDGKTPFGNVEKVILTTNIMHCGWEMDDKACFVVLEDGHSVVLTTNHDSLCIMKRQDVTDKINETEVNLNALKKMLELMGEDHE